jgi:hypothetical protein
MHIGSTLLKGFTVFTPWFYREADNAVFTYEIIGNPSTLTFTVTVEHKNTEDIGDGGNLSVSWSPASNAAGFHTATASGLKEMIRFKLTVSGSGTDGVLYRFLEPTWFDQAEGTAT